MKKHMCLLVLLVMIFSGCNKDEDEVGNLANSRPLIDFCCKIYFEDQRINDSIAGLEKDIDYSVEKLQNPYTNGEAIETKRLLKSLYTLDCTIDNGAEKFWGWGFLFDTDELSQKPYIILTAHLMAPESVDRTLDVTFQLCSEAIFGDENVHIISVKYFYNPKESASRGFFVPAEECYIDGKPGKILDYDLNIMEFKVFDD